jgi:hypothetical protein
VDAQRVGPHAESGAVDGDDFVFANDALRLIGGFLASRG